MIMRFTLSTTRNRQVQVSNIDKVSRTVKASTTLERQLKAMPLVQFPLQVRE